MGTVAVRLKRLDELRWFGGRLFRKWFSYSGLWICFDLLRLGSGGRRYFARVGWWRGCPARDENLRANASSEDLEGVKYIHLQRVMGRIGDTRRWPRLPRAQNAAVADSLESRGFTIKGGGGRLPEEHLPGPGGGRQGGTFVDVTAVRDGRTVRVQTIDTRADGLTPTTREANAAARIRAQQQPRDHTVLIPKRK